MAMAENFPTTTFPYDDTTKHLAPDVALVNMATSFKTYASVIQTI